MRDERKKIADYVRKTGCTIAEAGVHFRVSYSRVHAACIENGLIVGHEKKRRQSQAIVEFIDRGHTHSEACKEFGVSPRVVELAIVRENYRMPAGGKPNNRTLAILAELLNTSDTYRAIAERLKCSKSAVGHVVKLARKAGIKIPGRDAERARVEAMTPANGEAQS